MSGEWWAEGDKSPPHSYQSNFAIFNHKNNNTDADAAADDDADDDDDSGGGGGGGGGVDCLLKAFSPANHIGFTSWLLQNMHMT